MWLFWDMQVHWSTQSGSMLKCESYWKLALIGCSLSSFPTSVRHNYLWQGCLYQSLWHLKFGGRPTAAVGHWCKGLWQHWALSLLTSEFRGGQRLTKGGPLHAAGWKAWSVGGFPFKKMKMPSDSWCSLLHPVQLLPFPKKAKLCESFGTALSYWVGELDKQNLCQFVKNKQTTP